MIEFATDNRLDETATSVTGWSPCRHALAGPELVSDPALAGLDIEPSNNLLLMDGEVHRAVRGLITPYLTGARLQHLRERLTARSRSLVSSMLGSSDVDLIMDLAEPLVLEGIFSAMEVPEHRRPRLGELARAMLGLLEPELPPDSRRRATNAALKATLIFERDARAGAARGLHATLEVAAEQGIIPRKVARSTPVVVLHGGYENPLNQLGCVVAWAVSNPAAFRESAARNPAGLFEEIMRVYSPVRRVARWTASAGPSAQAPEQGAFVWVDLESANLDAGRFPAGGDVDLSGRPGHLGFGHGRHACPGSALARFEGQVLIRALLATPTDFLGEFTTEWRNGVVARGPVKIARGYAA
jgi:cytochrome P450